MGVLRLINQRGGIFDKWVASVQRGVETPLQTMILNLVYSRYLVFQEGRFVVFFSLSKDGCMDL